MTPPAPTAAVITGGAKAKLAADVFALPRNDALVHQVVTAELAARRQGTHSTKTRGLVAGGRAKPWRQKGTGRARQGTTRAPQWKGGGVAFPPNDRNFEVKINKKALKAALRSALSDHAQAGTLGVLDPAAFDNPSTKSAVALLDQWGQNQPLLVVVNDDEANLIKSFRNLDRAIITAPSELEVAAVVWARSLLVSQAALEAVQGRAAQ
jgi:large subunit ribosomal protein L4